MSLDTIILKAMKDKFNKKGDSFRMKHEFKMDGSVCSDAGKSPAMVITRDTGGWKWCCHRCNESGYIGDSFVDPDATLGKLKQLKEPETPPETYIVKLPDDFIPLVDEGCFLSCRAPFESHSWLWKYNITEKDMLEFGFGWSERYKMVILPLPSSDISGALTFKRVLDGWIGRRVLDSTKGKYHIQKPRGSLERLYFSVPNKSSNLMILVEDCVSAIRVNKALRGIPTTALLTTSIDEDLTRKLQGKEVYIWLDADALAKSVAMVARFRQLGIKAKHIYTTKDPKCYNNVAIKEIWNKSIKGYSEEEE